MSTYMLKAEEAERNWWIVDATDMVLGRMATQIASVLRGKNKPTYTPNVDGGDFVVVINADKIRMTGNKWKTKKYYRHSRFFGSLKEKTAEEKREQDPGFIILDSVRGMMPQNKLTEHLITKLKVYKGASHPHKAQGPQPLTIKKG